MTISRTNPIYNTDTPDKVRPFKPVLTPQQNEEAARQHERYQRIIFTFTVNNGEGEQQVYRAAFEAMKTQLPDGVDEDAQLRATVYYGDQMKVSDARSDNRGVWYGLMKACACTSIEVSFTARGKNTEEVLIEVRYAKQQD